MEKVLSIMKALSDGNRLRIVAALMAFDELCACQITELLQVSGATVSRHLASLVNAGVLESRKDGRWVFYRLNSANVAGPVLNWLKRELADSDKIAADRLALAKITACKLEDICRK